MGVALEQRSVSRQPDTLKGVGIAIAHAKTGEIWVNRELKDKAATARRAGQLSVPFETQKRGGELLQATILGGLAEVYDDFDNHGNPVMPDLSRNLLSIDAGYAATAEPFVFEHGGREIHFDLAVLIYDGSKDLPVSPHDKDEVSPVGWMSCDIFLASDVRPLARMAVEKIESKGLIAKRLTLYESNPELRQPVIPANFSMRDFYQRREKRADVGTGIK